MLGLRTADGISLSQYERSFGHSFFLNREEKIASLIHQEYAKVEDDRFHLTEKGFYVSNSILTELI
jgi:coproporphyrinogen III oxidase-like Fe-S oxidoreductase